MFRLTLKKIDPVCAALLLLGLAIRIGYLWYYRSLPDWDQLTVDNNYHHHWAQSIAAGNLLGDATYFRAPGYVYCLAALYRLFGDSLWVGRLFGVVIGVASILLTYLIARKVFSRRVALVAAALQVICPIMIYFEGELLLDSFFALLIQLCVYRVILWIEQPKSRNLFWVGITLGLSAIVRPTSLVLFVIVVPLVIWTVRNRAVMLKQLALLALGACLLIGPIFLRNLVVAGDPVMIASQGGINFYIGNNPAADGLSAVLPEPMGFNWRIAEITAIAERDAGHVLKPGEVSSYWSGQAWDWILSQPRDAVTLFARKLYFSFADKEVSNNRNLSLVFAANPFFRHNPLTFAPILGLACLGLLLSVRRNKHVQFVILTGLALTFFNALFFVNSRFRLPIVPLLIVLAALALVSIVDQLWKRHWKTAIIGLAAATLVATASRLDLVPLPPGTNAQWLNSQMLYYYGQHEDRRALEFGRNAASVDPTFPEVNLNLGNLWLRAGKTDSAAFYYQREISAHPGRAKAYTNLASLCLLRQRGDSALSIIQLALSRQPQDPLANALLIRILAANQSLTTDSLNHAVHEAVVRSARELRVLSEAASALVQSDALPEATPLLQEAIAARPPAIETDDAAFDTDFPNGPDRFDRRKATSYYLLGYVMGRSGQFDEAVRCSREAIRRDSTLVEAYANLVSGYLSLGKMADAESTLALAARLFPTNKQILQLSDEIGKMKRDRW